jgi:argininosuccinate lyase
MIHLSKLSEDLIIYSSSEFGMIQLSDLYSTGSSLMPQKKNPDSLELIRGKTSRVTGNLVSFMINLKGLPSTYNKDMQEDKQFLFDSADTLVVCVKIMRGVIESLTVNPQKMKGNLSEDMLATDVADYLVRKGMPFRKAHHVSGQVVALAEKQGCTLQQLGFEKFKAISELFENDIVQGSWWSYERSIESRNVVGGTSTESVKNQISNMRQVLKQQ